MEEAIRALPQGDIRLEVLQGTKLTKRDTDVIPSGLLGIGNRGREVPLWGDCDVVERRGGLAG